MAQSDLKILEELTQLMGKSFSKNIDLVTRDTTADDIDGWDSLAHARLMLAIEKYYGIRFPGAKLFGLSCVGDLVDLINECLGASSESTES